MALLCARTVTGKRISWPTPAYLPQRSHPGRMVAPANRERVLVGSWEQSKCSVCGKPALAFSAIGGGVHYRHVSSHDVRFHWAAGGSSPLYIAGGGNPHSGKSLHVVEGQTDAHALHAVGLPAIGVLGSGNIGKALAMLDEAGLLRDYAEVIVWRERGTGGEKFIDGARAAAAKLTFTLRIADWPLEADDARALLAQAAEAHRVRMSDDEYGGALTHLKLCAAIETGHERVADLAAAFRQRIEDIARDATYAGASSVEIVDTATAAPVQALEIPGGWRLSERMGVQAENADGAYITVIPAPLVIDAIEVDAHDGSERVALRWKARGHDRFLSAPREVVASTRRIVDLSAQGLPVTSDNALGVVRWLHRLEHANTLPRATVARRAGWAMGRHLSSAVDMSLDEGTGSARLLSGLSERGEVDESTAFLRRVVERHPMAACMCAASLTAALLAPLGMRGFALHLWGDSRGGKTAALKLALSLWGDPIRLMGSWSATANAIEAHAATLCDLPTALDELQAAKSVEHVAQTIYALANGVGRARATVTGDLGTQRQWRTVVLTTGEMPLLPEDAHDGARTRTIDIHAAPFAGEYATGDAAMAHDVSERAYGWIGQAMMRDSMLSPASRDLLRGEHAEATGALRERLGARADDVPPIKLSSAGAMVWALAWLGRHVGATDAREPVQVVAAMLAVATDQSREDDSYGSPTWKAANAILDLIAERPDAFNPHVASREVLGSAPTTRAGELDIDSGTAYLTTRGMREACTRAGVPYAKARALLHAAGVIDGSQASPRRGVMAQPVRCFAVSLDKIGEVPR